ncbi:protein archease, putative [Plasmodium berghei]|uniref:Protein archease-like n=2 Tax=Plasmodium berghei TaxID=5821 RepID=A0A509AKP5_PLABA|nr:protein archease, putative [Plasmodium berghei ANKA]CXI51614.1 protein archease, putative [Plasmodium berghei]SCL94463.1 protein archease, putative [Plasmodium berghei]SCM16031.1 protein archease, putative [Plasmodium berghei]SCM17827.1 protein archease, putative [Plasmodium berghei]SCN26097.1 protein archease, putative [Plasmodium berghei]|eukprot:XP_034421956.1 protein archease, putative [Plasmodium berghei ANKA]
MRDFPNSKIISLPQRNRRRINRSYVHEENESEYTNEIEENEATNDEIIDQNIMNDIEICNINLNKNYKYEYLDHTADIILHSYGNNLKEAFEAVCISLFNYMCDLKNVELKMKRKVSIKGDDLDDLLFKFLVEFHFLYGNEYFICKTIDIIVFDIEQFYIEAYGYGELFSTDKHECGTEIKAITKHELKIVSNNDSCDVFVLVDI